MIRTLLVTNDFPPKLGGIQSYLEALWLRLDPTSTCVLTASSDEGAAAYDEVLRARGLRIDRIGASTLYLPTRRAGAAVDAAIERFAPDLVLYDPWVPLGALGQRGGVPFGLVLHGAEVTIPARLPGLAGWSRDVLAHAAVVVSAGSYPESEARRLAGSTMPPVVRIPPGVDVSRFAPLDEGARASVRARLLLPSAGPLIVSVGRLVPRKGLDVLIDAAAICATKDASLTLAIAGAGRDLHRLQRRARSASVRVHFLGTVSEADKAALLGAADVFAQPCRSRWGGLEQEGFGIVFVEAAACGVPQVAGRSGGSDEAVATGTTGLVVDDPRDPIAVAAALDALLGDPARREQMGQAARERVRVEFDCDVLAGRLASGLEAAVGGARAPRS
ncbi:MAG TPA: glycosyltransferase family 4 protein [Acidimicrobiales bacterium]|nr:glycosyltransferase family 4 protein [Acidimicrobiales bacterium]